MAERRPIGSSGYNTITDMAMVDATPPAEGDLNQMLGVDAPDPGMAQNNNFNMSGLNLG